MKINNNLFNEWLEKEKGINYGDMGYWLGNKTAKVYVNKDWIIGLMVQYLLDKGLIIAKDVKKNNYLVATLNICDDKPVSEEKDLFTSLKEAIEGVDG